MNSLHIIKNVSFVLKVPKCVVDAATNLNQNSWMNSFLKNIQILKRKWNTLAKV